MPSSRRVPIGLCFVFALLVTLRTGDEVHRAERTFAVSKVAKQVKPRSAVLADDYHVPRASLGRLRHAELLSVGSFRDWCRWNPEWSAQFFN